METLCRILLIEDDAAVAEAIRLALRGIADVETFADPGTLPVPLTLGLYDAALLDMNFRPDQRDGNAGLDAIDRLRAVDPTLAIVMLTVFGGVAIAVEALKRGASDFLLKPWRNDRLVEAIRAAVALTARQRAGAAMSLDSRCASSTAGSCVQPASITCGSVSSCRFSAALIAGCAWPKRLTHHELVASM
ncbi:MAG TPA: response regulator [Sphingopyxis sp.]|uniref:response regulator n=1 Tax=Sphingopyxis sp. TaxID=1908224 RepID=UPI002C8B4C64|nr:response regulator [Sphingopyxis sp.]HWW58926.1 response regulator [Sphingopyxis sp.]